MAIAMSIIPYNLYLTTQRNYVKDTVLVCKEDAFDNLVLNATSKDVEKSNKSIFVRSRHAAIRQGYITLYRKLHKDYLLRNITEYYRQRNAVERIERYWQEYKRRKAMNVIRYYVMHWAYKPTGVLGRRIIAKLSSET